MCEVDVLDLSVRCQSQPSLHADVDNITSWTTTTTTPDGQLNTSPPWSGNSATSPPYDLEPISPCSSPGVTLIPGRRDVFYPRRPSDPVVPPRGPWLTDITAAQPTSGGVPPRRWNGDDGHPYSPLKRVLHQYQSQQNGGDITRQSNNGTANGMTSEVLTASRPSSVTSVPAAASAGRKSSTTAAAGMSFEDFVLGMLSKVGGGKAVTAATQSYLRESATSTSNRGVSGTTIPSGPRSTTSDDVVQSTHRPR